MEFELELVLMTLDTVLTKHWEKLPDIRIEKKGDYYIVLFHFPDYIMSIVIEKDKSIYDAMLNIEKDDIITSTTVRDELKKHEP